MNASGTLYVVCAPSGGGKTSLIKALLEKTPNLEVSTSHTTRSQRPNEVEGQHYYFVTPNVFEEMVAQQQFIEHAEVFGRHYGTAKTQLQQRLQAGSDVILDIDWQGARQISVFFQKVVKIFILPPSLEILQQRLSQRAQDPQDTIAHRMAKAQGEIAHFDEFDYLVVNDDFERALADFCAIIRSERLRLSEQRVKHGELLSKLLPTQ